MIGYYIMTSIKLHKFAEGKWKKLKKSTRFLQSNQLMMEENFVTQAFY